MVKFRGLNADEIDVRVAQVGNGWVQLLLYKDARVDMTILDETVGPENWQREHYECKGNLFCRVGLRQTIVQPDGHLEETWIWKSDCGSESNTEKEKGEASDSFKRACTNWGIGRELYTRIPIFVNTETISSGSGWKLKNKDSWSVKKVDIDKDANKINYIEIINKKGDTVFTYGQEIHNEPITEKNVEKIGQNLEENTNVDTQYKRVRRT